jgi:hypothetical protein
MKKAEEAAHLTDAMEKSPPLLPTDRQSASASMIPPRYLLWIDCVGALLVGAGMFALSGWLTELYQLPALVVTAIATANVAYGCFSLSLALRVKRPRAMITLLVLANAAWAVTCCVGAVMFWHEASIFGIAQFLLEGAYVGYLARLEWIHRDQLATASIPALTSPE